MDETSYDRRDAVQQCAAFVGFTFLASWTIWGALWAPGVLRLSIVPGLLMAAGWWAPAIVARVIAVLFRPRREPELAQPVIEPAPLTAYPLATVLVLGCMAATLGLAFALGACNWQWTWLQSGYPLVFGGSAASLTLEIYVVLNWAALWVQTAVVEVFYWLFLLIAISGAEIGWRGALLPRVVRAGFAPWLASIIVGALFGVWMWPLVWRGDATGFYPGAPLVGMPAAVACGVAWGAFLGWLYLRYERLGPVVIAATWIGWTAMVLPLVSSPFDPLVYADPRSFSAALVVGAVSAGLWRFLPPAAEAVIVEAVSE